MTLAAAAALLVGVALGWGLRASWQARGRRREGRMLSFIAHELNTPLTATNMTVLNFTSGIFGELGRDQKDWMAMLREQVQRLNSLVGELRDFIHLEFQRDLHIELEPVDLRAVLNGVLAQSEGTVTRSGAKIESDVADILPAVSADAERLPRVIASLLAHARKFRKEGPIRVAARSDGASAELKIEFLSQGLAAAQPERMLDLYYPAAGGPSSQLLSSVGTGLGFCRVLAERQGGSLALSVDELGRVELRLRLPLAPMEKK